jgi:hypothetical protein
MSDNNSEVTLLEARANSNGTINNNAKRKQQAMTPLPYPQFLILILVRFVEPIGFTMVFPFIYFVS